jgi:GNAT superfamily N-acetyltransferase
MPTQPESTIHLAETEADVRRCWPAFRELRPHLRSEDELVARWRTQLPESYRIIYAEHDGTVAAAAGYRFFHTLAWGHVLYVDDLVALQTFHRTGLGTLLLQYIQAEARRAGCDAVHLDTGYQRHLAHRAYLRNGFHFHCHHMARPVDHPDPSRANDAVA